MAKQLNVNLNFTADTRQAESNLASLKQQLETLAAQGNVLGSNKMNDNLVKAVQSAKDLSKHLNNAYNPKTGNLSLTKFDESLKRSRQNLLGLSNDLLGAGKTGQQAFMNLQNGIAAANVQLNKTQTLLGTFATTFMNTLRWQATSSIIHGVAGALSQAMGYARDLNKTLTDIRIVAPEKSLEDMAKFADIANKRAKDLSSTTLDYAKAALIYYQQGEKNLGGEQAVLERTDVTTKMANVTGDSVDEVSSYMTAIWNNFNKAGDHSVEHYADILTKLGAETAASTTEITDALEKYSAVADTIGLSYEAASAAATTLIDRTREAPEVAGTALKTVFARLEGLKVEGSITDEDGVTTTFNKYSQTLNAFGINIKNANGELKAADDILDEVGHKWKELSRDQQVALAQNVAGIRQWNQFAALMDNYDYFEQYKEMAQFDSEGALQEQQDIFAESWEAASKRVKTAWESIYSSIFDDQAIIKMVDAFGRVIEAVKITVDTMGGMKGTILLISALMFKAFKGNITTALENGISRVNKGFLTMTDAISSVGTGFQKLSAQHFVSLYNEVNKGTHSIQQQSQEVLRFAQTVENVPKYFQTWARELERTNQLTAQMNALGHNVSGTERAKLEAEIAYTNQLVESNVELNKKASLEKEAVDKMAAEMEFSEKATKQQIEANMKLVEMEKELLNLKSLSEETELGEQKALEKYLESKERLLELEKKEQDTKQQLTRAEELELDLLRELNAGQLSITEAIAIQREILREEITDYDKLNTAQTSFNNSLKDAEVNSQRISQQQDNIAKRIGDIAQRSSTLKGLVPGMVSGLSSAALSLSMIHSAIETIKSPDASGFEKFVSATMAASFAMGTLREAYMGLQGIIKAQLILQDQEIAKTIASNIVNGAAMSCEEAAAAAKAGKVLATEALTAAEVEETLTSAINGTITWEEAATHLGCADAKQLEAVATGALSTANKGLLKSALAVLGPMAALVAIAGALAFVGYNAYKSLNYNKDKLDELKESADITSTALDNLKTKTGEITSALSEWGDKVDTLRELEYGTSKWTRALSEANSQAKDVIESVNEMNDSLQGQSNSQLGANNLTELNKRLEDAGYEGTSSMDLIAGEDYFVNAEGAYEFTELGEVKINTINDMVVDQAQIIAHGAQMAVDQQEEAVAKENFMRTFGNELAGEVTGSTQTQGFGLDENGRLVYNTNNAITTEYNPDKIYDSVMKRALADNNFDITDLQMDDKGNLPEFLQTLVDQKVVSEDVAKKIAENSDMQNAILQQVELIKGNTESIAQNAQQDILANESTNQAIFGENSPLTEEQKEQYGTGITQVMGEDVAVGAQAYVNDDKKMLSLYKEIDATATDAGDKQLKDWYAEQNNIEKDSEEYTKITAETVKNAIAYQKALDDVNDRVEEYLKLIEDTEKDDKALKNISKTWEDQSDNFKTITDNAKEYEKAMKALKKNGGDWEKAFGDNKKLKKAAQAMEDYADLIRDDLAEALDISSDKIKNSVIDGEFIAQNGELIQDALGGDINAIQELQKQVALTNLAKNGGSIFDNLFEVKDEDFSNLENRFTKFLNNLNLDDVRVGIDIDEESANKTEGKVLAMMQTLLNSGAATQESISSMFGDMFNIEFDGYDLIPIEGKTQVQAEDSILRIHKLEMPVTEISGDGIGYHIDSKNMDQESFAKNKSKFEEAGYYAIPHVKGFKKNTNIPKVAPSGKTASKGNSGGSGNSGGKNKNKNTERKTRPRRQYEKSVIVERYKEITDQLDRNTKATERLAKLQEQLYGKDRLAKMDQVNKKHLAEIKLLRSKAKEAKNYLAEDKAMVGQRFRETAAIAQSALKKQAARFGKDKASQNLKKIINGMGKNFTYNSAGEISNYTKIMTALEDELNFYESVYNNPKNFNTEETQNAYKEKYITPLADAINRLQSAIDQYDETRELIQELKDNINEAYTEWLDLNYEKLTYSLEIKVTVNDNDLTYLDHKISQIEDDIYKTAEVLDYYFSGTGDTKLKLLNEAITIQTNNFKELDKAYQNGQITQEQYVQGLQEAYSALLSNVDAISNLKEEIIDYYGNVLSSAIAELDKYISRVDHVNSLLNHYQNILSLTGRATNYNLLEQLQAANAATATTLINMNKAEYETATNEAEKYLKAYNEIKQKIEEREKQVGNIKNDEVMQNLKDEAEVMRKAYETALETANNAEEQMFASVQDALENAAFMLETALERAAKAVEKALTGIVGSFDELARQMNMTSTRQDEYLTKTNQSYELNKMQRTLAKDMDKTDSKAAKARLANFSKELKALEEKDELSNLELEIAQKKYELLKAQIALEDSQNAKSVIRLSRDNEGNYGYVYVANEEETEDAEQAVEDAKNDLYNLQLEATNNYGQKTVQAIQEMQDVLYSFFTSDEFKAMTDEERNYRIAKIQEQYGKEIGSYSSLFGIGYGATDYLEDQLKNDSWFYKNYIDNFDLMQNNLETFNTEIDAANTALDVFKTNTNEIGKFVNFEQRMDDVVTSTEKTMNSLAKNFEEAGEDMTKILNDVGNKITKFVDTTIPQMNKWIANADNIAEQIKNIIENATNGKIDRSTENLNEFLVKWGGENSNYKYTSNHIAYNDTTTSLGLGTNAEKWTADTIAKNEEIAKKLLAAFESGQRGYFGFNKNGLMSYITGVTTSDAAYKTWAKKVVKPTAFDTGGYTGEWTKDGKIAVLHEKELVLNETDTKNILDAVNIVRDKNFLSSLSSPSFSWNKDNQQLEQNVKIEAQFPNVTDRYEIEQAFSNLVNRASQHAFNNRK